MFNMIDPNLQKLIAEQGRKDESFVLPSQEGDPWHNEPDIFDWEDDLTGFPILIQRKYHGAFCGYVFLTKEEFESISWLGSDWFEVHGGVTFMGLLDSPKSDFPYAIGFDCAHSDDYCPVPVFDFGMKENYRTFEYVYYQCRMLSFQIKKALVYQPDYRRSRNVAKAVCAVLKMSSTPNSTSIPIFEKFLDKQFAPYKGGSD